MPKNAVATSVPAPFDAGKKIPAQPAKEPRKIQSRSEYILLNRAWDKCNDTEQDFLIAFLEDCAKGQLSPPELALHHASKFYRLGISVDSIDDDMARVIRSLRMIELKAPWLFRFYSSVEHLMEQGPATTDMVADLLGMAIDDVETEVEIAKQVLWRHPEALADDIRKAAAALTDVKGAEARNA